MMVANHSYKVLRTAFLERDKDTIIQTVRNLIEKGKDVNSINYDGYSVFIAAARQGYVECLQMMLEAGADVDQSNWEEATALIEAASVGHVECVRLLLEAGADMNHSDRDSKTALMKVARRGYVKCMRLLLEGGANVNHSDEENDTALIEAAVRGHVECVRLLLEAGANVNDMDNGGETALICCLTFYVHKPVNTIEAKACLKLLINAGADIDAGNKNYGTCPIHYALLIWPHFKFPLEYLISENCNLIGASYDQIQHSVYRAYLKEETLNILKFLFACGLPLHLCQSYILGQETSVRKWVEIIASQPNTLKSICVFQIRRNLGHGIKSKVTKLNLPTVIQNLILLTGILSLECFV